MARCRFCAALAMLCLVAPASSHRGLARDQQEQPEQQEGEAPTVASEDTRLWHPRRSPRMPFDVPPGQAIAGGSPLLPPPQWKVVALSRRQHSRMPPPAPPLGGGDEALAGRGRPRPRPDCPTGQCANATGACVSAPAGGCPTTNGIMYNSQDNIMRSAKLIPIYYGSWTATGISTMNSFLAGLGGSSWMSTTAQYADTRGFFVNSRTSLSYSSAQQYNYNGAPYGTNLQDAQVWQAVYNAVTKIGAGVPDPNAIYLLLTGPDIGQTSCCAYNTSNQCAQPCSFCTAYCGWHTWNWVNNVQLKYGWIGNAALLCPRSCIMTSYLNSDIAAPNNNRGWDGMISVLAHEITETISDPLLTGWYDAAGNENADKCAWTFGTVYSWRAARNAPPKYYNTVDTNGRRYLIQRNFSPRISPASSACVMSA